MPTVTSKIAEPVVNTMNPDTVFGTSGPAWSRPMTCQCRASSVALAWATIDSGEVDPVAEAEVYIAYGREAQAEEILREALLRDSSCRRGHQAGRDLRSVRQARRFDKFANDITAMDSSGEYRAKLADIASTLSRAILWQVAVAVLLRRSALRWQYPRPRQWSLRPLSLLPQPRW